MSSAESGIHHVSDTALMVAACRAIENDAGDGFLRDPFAARLAGERGMSIFRAMPHAEMMRFGIGMRSRFLDELILEALASNRIATVLSLGCGLDARPWRLDLPPDLRWIEVDFPDMLDYKDSVLSSETPRCRRERISADLNNAAQRQAILQALGSEPALMITEGLLMYLPAATIDALATEARQLSSVTHWMADIVSAAFHRALHTDTMNTVRHVQAPDSLPGERILDAVYRQGWTTVARRSYITDSAFAMERARRIMGTDAQRTAPPPEMLIDPTGVHVFGRV